MASHSKDSPFPAYGSRVGPWIVGKCIGGGSYGDVWLARNVVGTWRAVKVVFRPGRR